MRQWIEKFRSGLKWMEAPFLVRQVETHLVLGPISRHFPIGYFFVASALVRLAAGAFPTISLPDRHQFNLSQKLVGLCSSLGLLCMSRRQQAIIAWVAIKPAIGVAAIMLVTVGARISFARGRPDEWPNLLLGLLWIPALEFVPSITPHQRFITVGGIVRPIGTLYLLWCYQRVLALVGIGDLSWAIVRSTYRQTW